MHEQLGQFSSTTLAGDPLSVPTDLTGLTLLLFAYKQHQQTDVDTWIRLVANDDDVRVIEVPLLGRKWIPTRSFINGGMASAMDDATRRQTMCVYTDVAGFKRNVLGVTSPEVLATLVDASGSVLWHEFGSASPSSAEMLTSAIDDVRPAR